MRRKLSPLLSKIFQFFFVFFLLISVNGFGSNEKDKINIELAFPHLKFSKPVDIQHSPDSSRRLFVVEQYGKIKVFANNKHSKSSSIFLDISNKVSVRHGEMGLLGLAFHPHYKTNGYFFVNYTASNPLRTVISRFSADPKNTHKALASSETLIIQIQQPYRNHNGGGLQFGKDGYLYIGLGDGGHANDKDLNSQNLKTLLGAMLRIDVDKVEEDKNYSIPKDNPFIGNNKGYREEIWAYGLRNPWRFSIEAGGDFWTGDVGQNDVEEVHYLKKSQNAAWPLKDGFKNFRHNTLKGPHPLVDPVFTYKHKQGLSVIWAGLYQDKNTPSLYNHYIYADYYSGNCWKFNRNPAGQYKNELFAKVPIHISSFGFDENKSMLICAHLQGKIYKFK